MHIPSSLSFLMEQDGIVDFEESRLPIPTIITSQTTLMALNKVHETTIPFIGSEEPQEFPTRESIRALWDRPEEDVALRSYTSKQNKKASSRYSVVAYRTLVPTALAFQVGDLIPKGGYNSFEPTTPIVLPVEARTEPKTFCLDAFCATLADKGDDSSSPAQEVWTASTVEDETQISHAVDSVSTTSQNRDREEGRQALRKAILSIRKRRAEKYRKVVSQMLTDGIDLERLVQFLFPADDAWAEW